MVGNKILVKKKDPPVCPGFWYGREQNSGEKERPSCMSQNFGMVGNKILVKKKDPPVCPEFWYGREQNTGEKKDTPVCPKILVWSGTKFW